MPGLALSVYEVVRELRLKLSTLESVSVRAYNRDLLSFSSYKRQIVGLSGELSYGSSPKDDLNYLFYFTYFAEYKSHPYYDDFTTKINEHIKKLTESIDKLHSSHSQLKETVTDTHSNTKELIESISLIESKVKDSIQKSTQHIQQQIQTYKQKMQQSVTQIDQNIQTINKKIKEYIEGELKQIVRQFKDKLTQIFRTFYSTLTRGAPFAGQHLDYRHLEIDGKIVNDINSLIPEIYKDYCDMSGSLNLYRGWPGHLSSRGSDTRDGGQNCEAPFKQIDTAILSNNAIYNLNESLKDFADHIQRVSPSNLRQEKGMDSLVSDINLDYSTFDTDRYGDVNLEPFHTYLEEIKSGYTYILTEYYGQIEREFPAIKVELDKLQPVLKELQTLKPLILVTSKHTNGLDRTEQFIQIRDKIGKLTDGALANTISGIQQDLERAYSYTGGFSQITKLLPILRDIKESYQMPRHYIEQQLEFIGDQFTNQVRHKFYSQLYPLVHFISDNTIDTDELQKLNLLIVDLEDHSTEKQLQKINTDLPLTETINSLNKALKALKNHVDTLNNKESMDKLVARMELTYDDLDRHSRGGYVNLKPFIKYLAKVNSKFTAKTKELIRPIQREFATVKVELDKLKTVKEKLEQVIGKDKLKSYLDYQTEIDKIEAFITLNTLLQNFLAKAGDEIPKLEGGIAEFRNYVNYTLNQNLRFLKGIKGTRPKKVIELQLKTVKSMFKLELKKHLSNFYSNLSSHIQFISPNTVDLASLQTVNKVISDIEDVPNGNKRLDRINENQDKTPNFENLNKALSKLRKFVDRTNPDNLSTPDDVDTLVTARLNFDYDRFDRQDLTKPFDDFTNKLKTQYVGDIREKRQVLQKHFDQFNSAIQPLEQVKQEMDRLYYLKNSNHKAYSLIDSLLRTRNNIHNLLTNVSGKIVPALERGIETVTAEFHLQTRPQLTNLMQLRELNDTLQGHISRIKSVGQLVSSLQTGQKDLQQFETNFKRFNSSGYFRDVSEIVYTLQNLETATTTTVDVPSSHTLHDARQRLTETRKKLNELIGSLNNASYLEHITSELKKLDSVKQDIEKMQKRDQESVMAKLKAEKQKLESFEPTINSIGLTVSELKTFSQQLHNFKRMEQNFQSLLSHHKLMEINNSILKDITTLELAKPTANNGFDSELKGAKDKLQQISKAFDDIKQSIEKYAKAHNEGDGLHNIKSHLEQIKTHQVYKMIQNINQIEEKGRMIQPLYTDYSHKFREFNLQIDRLYHCIDYVVRDFIRCSLESLGDSLTKRDTDYNKVRIIIKQATSELYESNTPISQHSHANPTRTPNQQSGSITNLNTGSSYNHGSTTRITALTRSLSRLGNRLRCYSWTVLSHLSVAESKLCVSRLYEY